MSEWDATTYEGKDNILRVVRNEAEGLFRLIEDPSIWERETACSRWTTRDVVGHLVDTTEGYFAAFDAARSNSDPGEVYGLLAMSQRAGDRAVDFRVTPREEMIERLHTDFDKVMQLLAAIGPDEWTGLTVVHAYMGPLPAFFYAAGQLMDYTVHSWDIRERSGKYHAISGEAADLLAPFMLVLWQSTVKPDVDKTPFEIGVRITSGRNAGDFRFSVSPDGMTFKPGAVDGLPSVLEFDPASLVLTTFGRCNAGTVRGDGVLAARFLNLFFRI